MKYIKLLIPAVGLALAIGATATVDHDEIGILIQVVLYAFTAASTYLILAEKW